MSLNGVYTGDWIYLSAENTRVLLGALKAVGSTNTDIQEALEQHLAQLEAANGEDTGEPNTPVVDTPICVR